MLGTSVIASFKFNNGKHLGDLGYLKNAGLTSARYAGAKIVDEALTYKSKEGNCQVIIPLAESHIAIYTDLTLKTLELDIFTCRSIRARDVLSELKRHFPSNYVGHEYWYPRGGFVEENSYTYSRR